MAYVETRKTWIKAIHKCIMEKWNPICMGCVDEEPDCALCKKAEHYRGYCNICSLGKAKMECNAGGDNPYETYSDATDCDGCEQDEAECDLECPGACSRPDEAEAMLEALVQLLPPEERKRYEP
jgi:hypothetical protein